MTINELREKRNNAWNAAKAFLDSHRTEKGTLTAEDDATYTRMEQDIADLGKEIARLERQEALEAELSKPVNMPLTSKPSLTADDVIKLVYALKRPYRKNAKFIMNDQTIASIRQLKDNNGAYMWQPSLVAGEPDKLLGYDVYTSPFCPAGKIAFGDYSYYNIGDRGTRSFKQLTELFAGNGMIGYVAKERVDGKLILPEAVQILTITGSTKAAKA